MPDVFATPRPAPVPPAHIAAFGQRFGPRTHFSPEPEGEGSPQPSRAQFVAEEKARQLDKGVEYLASKNAELQYDLNRAHRAFNPETHVAISKADAALLDTYRTEFPTPKEAKEAKAKLGTLEARDEQRSYDDARREAIAGFKDLPEQFQKLIPTAEELLSQPGGEARLKNLDFMKSEVEKYAGAYGAVKQDQTKETDVGKSPGEIKAADAARPDSEADARKAAQDLIDRRYNIKKEA